MIGAASMELDELKTAWQSLGSQLQQQNRISLQLLRDKKLDKTRKSLRPLYWGHIVQVVLGIVSIIFGVSVWTKNIDSAPLLVSGIVAHLYGILLIITAGQVMYQIKKLDYSAPVLGIQKQISRVERTYVNNGWLIGLPWWLLWIPYTLGILALIGIDLAPKVSIGWIIWSIAAGVAGMVITWLWYRWATNPKRAERAQKINQAIAGASLTQAKQFVQEIEQFEQEEPSAPDQARDRF